ncbi:hypothetical protein [Micromonospora tulbaghiae]|uniref:hypothetical protein n=1 Tax=Micromonospora tulbaghiae TaxID=479978 RepID=UPI001FD26C0E|nr:hypothetical protein [Micromonospora tulbaghiae]
MAPPASVQFISPIFFRVIRVLGWRTYDGWLWLEGYQLNIKGDAVARRAISVQQAGLRPVRRMGLRPSPSGRAEGDSGVRATRASGSKGTQ